MYRKHFALTRHPFEKDLAPDDLFETASLRELTVRLTHLLDMRGIGLVTGESGSGKTTACRRLVAGLNTGLHRVLYVSLTTGNVMDLYKTIAWELGLPTERNRAALFKQIRSEVSRLCAENRLRPVLIVDEAHHLRTDVLEDLRLLTNYGLREPPLRRPRRTPRPATTPQHGRPRRPRPEGRRASPRPRHRARRARPLPRASTPPRRM